MEGEYYKTKDSVNEYIKAAEGFDGKKIIEQLKPILSTGSSLLELGSGPGTDWQILNTTYNVIGSDNSTDFLNHLQSKFPKGDFLELDASTLKTDHKFDGIYSNKVLHHLTNEELTESITRQYDLLNTGGVICHSFWKGEDSEVFKGLFVNYHTKTTLKLYFEKYFNQISIVEYAEFEKDDSLLLIAIKK